MISYSVRNRSPYYQEFVYRNDFLIGDIMEFPVLGYFLVTVQTNDNPLSTKVQSYKTISQAKQYISSLFNQV